MLVFISNTHVTELTMMELGVTSMFSDFKNYGSTSNNWSLYPSISSYNNKPCYLCNILQYTKRIHLHFSYLTLAIRNKKSSLFDTLCLIQMIQNWRTRSLKNNTFALFISSTSIKCTLPCVERDF